MALNPREWMKQAVYDMDTAEYMHRGGRYFYAVFMCHLSIEKALKGLYQEKLGEIPPKTHNLVYLVEKIKLRIPEPFYDILYTLNRVSVPTRYPDDLQRILGEYDRERTKKLLDEAAEILLWLKTELEKPFPTSNDV